MLPAVARRVAGSRVPHAVSLASRAHNLPLGAQSRAFSNTEDEVEKVLKWKMERAKRELAILAEAFQRYDGDRSGALDKDEIAKALEDLDLPHGDIDVATLVNRLDSNKSGTIELSEWLERLPRGTRLTIVEKFEDDGVQSADAARSVRLTLPSGKIIYTYTDEAPMLATYSLLPIVRAFCKSSKVAIELRDISVAGRILAHFPWATATSSVSESPEKTHDALAELGELSKTPQANIIKLPNVSASIPQLKECIAELKSQGFLLPDYPEDPKTDEEKQTQATYAKVLGSAVNPVLREGNSDRRVAGPVKEYAQAHPHKLKPWATDSKTHVSHMKKGDFFSSEKSAAMSAATTVRIELVAGDKVTVLKPRTPLLAGEVIDASVMSAECLREFFEEEFNDAKASGLLLSLHLKATMMKISDPIMFGHATSVFFKETFTKHAALFESLGINANMGLGDLYKKLASAPEATQSEVKASIQADYDNRPSLAMVDSDLGITNLHVSSDVIIDASMPPMIRDGGKMWNADDKLQETKALVPDRCYAGMYAAIVDDCKENGAFDVSTMGNVANVGLMAQKAEEYGSHDKTFEIPEMGRVRVVDINSGATVFEHEVAKGDIWRMCQTKDSPIQDWVKLAVSRAKDTGDPAIFWLDKERAHDATMIEKVNLYLKDYDTTGLDIRILPPVDAMKATLVRVRKGENTISVTGNVLRDYLTDLFPILELGTSAKMLSIVPLLAGGGLYETGAGGSAPKHIQQLIKENHLRWDSLGEFLALAVSLDDLGAKTGNPRERVLASTLNEAIGKVLSNGKSPGRKAGQLDNRGSHFYLALYWAEALAEQKESARLSEQFTRVFKHLSEKETTIVDELLAVAKKPADIGGYYHPCPEKTEEVMRPSATLNAIIDDLQYAAPKPSFMGESERRAYVR